MPLFSFEGLVPTVSPTAWIAPTATLVGDVRVEDDASVWYRAVLRSALLAVIRNGRARGRVGGAPWDRMTVMEFGVGIFPRHDAIRPGDVARRARERGPAS